MIDDFGNDIAVGIIATVSVCLALTGGGRAAIRFGASRFAARKVSHMLCGLVVGLAAINISHQAVALGLLSATAIVLAISVELKLLPDVLDGARGRDYGLVGFATGVLAAVAAFWPDRAAISAGVFVLGLADPLAALIGSRWGRHRVAVGATARSLEGSAVFSVTACAISMIVMVFGYRVDWSTSVAVAVFVALTTAAIELLVAPAVDNLLITPWVALLIHLGRDLSGVDAHRWGLAAALAFGLVPVIVRLRWLDLPGSIGAALVMASAIGLGGWVWAVPVSTFFILTSLLTAWRRVRRVESMRGLSQVMVNGILPVMVPLVGFAMNRHQVWFFVYIGGIAASTADSWASEIGRFSRRSPVSLRSWRRVPGGTSGAVSALGLLATWAGGLVIGIVGTMTGNAVMVVVGMVAGVAGSLLDSVIGATLQARFRCQTCGAALEEPHHCGSPAELSSGVSWMDNDVVNLLANATGMAVALLVFGLESL